MNGGERAAVVENNLNWLKVNVVGLYHKKILSFSPQVQIQTNTTPTNRCDDHILVGKNITHHKIPVNVSEGKHAIITYKDNTIHPRH